MEDKQREELKKIEEEINVIRLEVIDKIQQILKLEKGSPLLLQYKTELHGLEERLKKAQDELKKFQSG